MPRPSRYVHGAQHGRLILLERIGADKVRCRCTCGTEKIVYLGHVIHGKTQSCGCLHKEITSAVMTERQTKHGMFGTPIYGVWAAMLGRCRNPEHQAYHNYGGRGIKVCKRWEKFENFYADMGDAPEGMTLERCKNHLGYSPKNCVWASPKAQMNNRRSCALLTHAGKTQNITQWAEELKIPRQLLYSRHRLGWTAEEILTTPLRRKN